MDAAPPPPPPPAGTGNIRRGSFEQTLAGLARFLPRVSGQLVVDGPLGRLQLQGRADTVRIHLSEVPDLDTLRGLFPRSAEPRGAAPEPGSAGSKRQAASSTREQARMLAAALDDAGLTLEVFVTGQPLAVLGRRADPGLITRALGLGRVELHGRTALKLARDLLG